MAKSNTIPAPTTETESFRLSGSMPEGYRKLVTGAAEWIANALGSTRRIDDPNPFAPYSAEPENGPVAYQALVGWKDEEGTQQAGTGVISHWRPDGQRGTKWVSARPETCILCEERASQVLVAGASLYRLAYSPIQFLCEPHARNLVMGIAARMVIRFKPEVTDRLAALREAETGEDPSAALAIPLKEFLRYSKLRYLTAVERANHEINFSL